MYESAGDYVAVGEQYARDVVDGSIPACLYVRQACQRQLNDLERAAAGWKYQFDRERANRACRFIEKLPHIKGRWAKEGRTIELEPWQVFIVTTVFGWVDAEGRRRFRSVYEEVPRKNAKSTKVAGVGLYGGTADREPGAEIYSAATTRDQAKVVWDVAKKMVERTPGLRRRFGVQALAHHIEIAKTDSVFRALSREQKGNYDGLNVHVAVNDELHAHPTRDMYDVLETATGSREQPLIWNITTAGSNRAGICYELRAYSIKILGGQVEDDTWFAIIYTLDAEEVEDVGRCLSDPELWRKANPNYGVSVDPDDLARKAAKARETPSAQANFLTKHLNVWVGAAAQWANMQVWDRLARPDLRMETFLGKRCWIAADLASKVDVAAVRLLFEEGGYRYGFGRFYLPEALVQSAGDLTGHAARESRNSQYAGWVRGGHLIATPGNIIDYEWIEEDIRRFCRMFDVQAIGFDPFQATYISTRLLADRLPVIEYGQTVKNMSEPMKEWESWMIDGTFVHDDNPVMNWMMSNVVAKEDRKENVFPNKEFRENKIDGPVAQIMTIGMALGANPDAGELPDDYELMAV